MNCNHEWGKSTLERNKGEIICSYCGSTGAKEAYRLQIYDQLRQMHSILKDIDDLDDNFDQCAIEAVDRVLYLAEGVFARNE